MGLRFKSLGSGSAGNGTLVESHGPGGNTTRVLVDCGFGLKHLERRLAEAGVQPADISAVFITHEHGDHIGCARVFARRFGVALWMSQGTRSAIGGPDLDGLINIARDGQTIDLADMQLMPFTVPHDAREPLQLTCSDGTAKLGILTDLGHATPHIVDQLQHCHALLIECNHDPDMLAESAYPAFLKQRVGGPHGHLSNQAAADIVKSVQHTGLHTLVAAHLSAQNNRPELARLALAQTAACSSQAIWVADAGDGSPWLAVSRPV